MRDGHGRGVAGGNDHAHAHLGNVEQTTGKFVRQADAAMRSRMPRQHPAMERDARPGEALHVGHEGIVVEVGIVLRLLLEDAEDAGGRFAAFLAGRYRCAQYPTFGVVDRDLLALQRHDGHDRLAGTAAVDRGAPLLLSLMAGCGPCPAARCDHGGQGHGRPMRQS